MIKPLIALTLLSTPTLAKPIELIYKFDTDAPLHYTMVQSVDQVQELPGMTVTTNTVTTNRFRTELIKNNNDGTFIIQNTTDDIQFEMTGAGIELSYDSTNPEDKSKLSNPTIASIAIMNNIGIQFHIDQSGSIIDVPNIVEIKDSVLDMEDVNLWMLFDAMTDKETLIAMNEANYKLLPTQPIEIGDHWYCSFEIPSAGTVTNMVLKLSLDKIKNTNNNEVAHISFTGHLTADYGEELNEIMNLLDSEITGKIEFNMNDGIYDAFTMLSTFKITSNYSGNEQPDMTQKIKQSITTTRIQD